MISRSHTFFRFSITEEGREPLVVYIKVSSRKYVNQTSIPGYVIFTMFAIRYLSYTWGFWEAILKIDIYIFGCLKVSLQVKEVLEVVKLIQTTALLITLFIHYFIISAVKEISKSSYLARYSGNYCWSIQKLFPILSFRTFLKWKETSEIIANEWWQKIILLVKKFNEPIRNVLSNIICENVKYSCY